MNSACVSSRKGFRLECLTWKTATLSFRSLKELCERTSEKAFDNFSGVVSEGKVSTGLGVDDWMPLATVIRLSGLRARRATAKLPWAGEARIRAMPAPCCRLVVDHIHWETGMYTDVGPAPISMASPLGGIVS